MYFPARRIVEMVAGECKKAPLTQRVAVEEPPLIHQVGGALTGTVVAKHNDLSAKQLCVQLESVAHQEKKSFAHLPEAPQISRLLPTFPDRYPQYVHKAYFVGCRRNGQSP